MRLLNRLVIVMIAMHWFITINAEEYDIGEKPSAASPELVEYFGEFVFNDQKIIIRENAGKLEAVLDPIVYNPRVDGENPKLPKIWPLSPIDKDKYTYTFNGTMANFIFQRDQNKNINALLVNQDQYLRQFIEPRNGNTFKVSLDKDISEYLKAALEAEPPEQDGDFRQPDLIDITTVIDNVKLDVRYATTNNFLDVPTYSMAKSFLQRPAAMAVAQANIKLTKMGFGLLVHDAYRPWYVTKIFWDATEGPERDFVANPQSGSKHNMGSAIDLTLYDLETGEPIKMVGTYDEMSDRSYPHYMGGTALERWHRDLLRIAMEEVGFTVVYNEWWHFDYKDWEKYPILNLTFEEILSK